MAEAARAGGIADKAKRTMAKTEDNRRRRFTGVLPAADRSKGGRAGRGARAGILRYFAALALSSLLLPLNAAPGRADGLAAGLGWTGAWWANLRLRHERVLGDGPIRAASAQTARARIGAVSAPRLGFSLLGELETVFPVGQPSFDDGVNGNTSFATVPDPETAEINQLLLRYDRGPIGFVAGRQRIVLDRARFIGDANFRQNQQTFDAVSVIATPSPGARIRYDYMTDALRPGAPHAPLGSLDLEGHLLHVGWRSRGGLDASAFAYLLDFDDAPSLSSATIGARLQRTAGGAGPARFIYELSLAQQRDHGNNAQDYSLAYWLVMPGVAVGPFTASLGVERLDGNGRIAVSAPLGTLHAYQGAADLFTDTPNTGIEDRFLQADYKLTRVGPWDSVRVWGAIHRYVAATTDRALGREIDLAASVSFASAYKVTVAAARYDSESFGDDTNKYWLTLDIAF